MPCQTWHKQFAEFLLSNTNRSMLPSCGGCVSLQRNEPFHQPVKTGGFNWTDVMRQIATRVQSNLKQRVLLEYSLKGKVRKGITFKTLLEQWTICARWQCRSVGLIFWTNYMSKSGFLPLGTYDSRSLELDPRQHPVHRNEARPAVSEHLHTGLFGLRTENRPKRLCSTLKGKRPFKTPHACCSFSSEQDWFGPVWSSYNGAVRRCGEKKKKKRTQLAEKKNGFLWSCKCSSSRHLL